MIETGNKNFWIAQAIGWGSMALSNLIVQFLAGFPANLLFSNALGPFLCGFVVTTAYRYAIKDISWKQWNFGRMTLLILGSTVLLTSLFMVCTWLLFTFVFRLEGGMSMAGILGNFIIFLLILLIWNLIYFSIHYFNNWNKAEIEKWQLAAEMKDAQLGSLKSQINPHFVFNTLNNIRALILEDKEKAREMLLNFSDLFRYSLKHNDQTQVDLQEEMEIVNQYLELLSIQFEHRLSYVIRVEKGLNQMKVPPMILQLLVENAVKHGISQQKEGGVINIDIEKNASSIEIIVKNTGDLIKSARLGEKLGVGLENIRKRLELIYSGNAHFLMFEKQDFVIVKINLPLV